MDHDTAASTNATERYLLGEMPPDERETFEEHLLSCKVCGDDMHHATMFVENAKAVFRERSLGRSKAVEGGWRSWFQLQFAVPAFAALALAVLVSYQNVVVIPGLRTPRALPAAVILDGVTRSGLPKVTARQGFRFQMAVDVPATVRRLSVEVTSETGTRVWSGTVDAPGLNQPLDVYFPDKVSPGRYRIVIRAAQGDVSGPELMSDRFEVIAQGE